MSTQTNRICSVQYVFILFYTRGRDIYFDNSTTSESRNVINIFKMEHVNKTNYKLNISVCFRNLVDE